MDTRSDDKHRRAERQVNQLWTELDDIPVRLPKVRVNPKAPINIVSGSVIGSQQGTSAFQIDQLDLRHGVMPNGKVEGSEVDPTGRLDVENLFLQDFDDNDLAIAFQEVGTGDWLCFKPGGGNEIVYAELTEDLDLIQIDALARPVDADGVMDTGADEFYLIDDGTHQARFVGKAEYTDGDASGTIHAGYRYIAYKVTDNYKLDAEVNPVPGYRIIDGEGPARLLTVTLKESASMSGTQCSIIHTYGTPDNGREPRIESDDYDLIVEDPDDYALNAGAEEDDEWLVVYDEDFDRYNFLMKLSSTKEFRFLKVTTEAPVAGSGDWTTSTIACTVAGSTPKTLPINVANDNPEIDAPSGFDVWVFYDPCVQKWRPLGNTPWDMRALPGWSESGGTQLLGWKPDGGDPKPEWFVTHTGDVIDSIDSIDLSTPMDTSLKVELDFKYKTVIIVGAAPSVTADDVQDTETGTECPDP